MHRLTHTVSILEYYINEKASTGTCNKPHETRCAFGPVTQLGYVERRRRKQISTHWTFHEKNKNKKIKITPNYCIRRINFRSVSSNTCSELWVFVPEWTFLSWAPWWRQKDWRQGAPPKRLSCLFGLAAVLSTGTALLSGMNGLLTESTRFPASAHGPPQARSHELKTLRG